MISADPPAHLFRSNAPPSECLKNNTPVHTEVLWCCGGGEFFKTKGKVQD
jgi:hypothetical protein